MFHSPKDAVYFVADGGDYVELSEYNHLLDVSLSIAASPAVFGAGPPIAGAVMQFRISQIPEPGSAMILAIGGIGVLALVGRRPRPSRRVL